MAGSKYASTGTQNVTTPADTVLGITGTAAQRLWCHFFCVSSYATPADNAIFWTLQRYTAAGTSTGVTPVALDPADPASVGVSGENHTVEPTYTAATELWENAVNQRASLQLWTAPGAEFVCPATAAAGIGWQPLHASFAGVVETTCHWTE